MTKPQTKNLSHNRLKELKLVKISQMPTWSQRPNYSELEKNDTVYIARVFYFLSLSLFDTTHANANANVGIILYFDQDFFCF